jgi:hypothetical protein
MIIVDDALLKEDFIQIKNALTSEEFPWFFNTGISYKHDGDDYYFTHLFYVNFSKNSVYYDIVNPLINFISPYALIRVKANMYPGTKEKVIHKTHTDYPYVHRGAILYINTNNGYTILEDGQKVESVENRILFFDASKPHSSTTCTDDKVRVNININYYGEK